MPAIEVKALIKKFGGFTALDNLSLTIEEGQSYALLGPNGAGKTTLIRILGTVLRPTSGRVIVNGYDVAKEAAAVKKSIGLVTHNPFLYDELTVEENLSFYAGLFDADADSDLIEKLGLKEVRNKRVGALSRGLKQRTAIARALLHRPRILLLDEPTTGLDVKSRALFYALTQELQDEGATIVMSTHLLEEAARICGSGVVLNRGRIAGEVELSRGTEEAAALLRGLK
jgi:heme ABC exporter ATP-binding subunit CcmA